MGKMTPAGEISGAPAIGGIGTCLLVRDMPRFVWRRAAATRLGNECHSLTPRIGPDPPASDPDRPASSADILTFKGNENPELGFVGYVV